MIKTKHNIEIEIDENKHSIVVQENMSVAQKEQLDATRKEYENSYEERDGVQNELMDLEEEYGINGHILANGTKEEKSEVMFVQKKLFKKISKLRKKLKELNANVTDISKIFEEGFKNRFEVTVSGAGKESLKAEMEAKNISYQVLFAEITKKVQASNKKK